MNLSAQELEKWISSDEIEINAEGDVFKIITMWVGQDRDERKRSFEELFRHVRVLLPHGRRLRVTSSRVPIRRNSMSTKYDLKF